MLNNGRKRKTNTLSSGGEDEKVKGSHCLTKDDHSKRKQSSNVHDRQQRKECPPPTDKDVSKSHRQIKKAVYKLSKDDRKRRPVEIEVGCKGTKTVDNPSRKITPSTQTKSDPSGNRTFPPVGQTVVSGLSQPRNSHSKDSHTPERTAKHEPHRTSSRKGSSESIQPADYKHKPPSSNKSLIPVKACTGKVDTALVKTTEQSKTSSSSAKESRRRGKWKPLNEPPEDDHRAPAGAKSSVSPPPHRTPKHPPSYPTRATSVEIPKRPILTQSPSQVPPGSPCGLGAGGALIPRLPAVKFTIPKRTRPTVNWKDDCGKRNKQNENGGVSTCTTSSGRSSEPADCKDSHEKGPKETAPVQSVQSVQSPAVGPFLSSQSGQNGSSEVSHQAMQCVYAPPSYILNTQDEGSSITYENDHEMQVVEALHQARSEWRLELNVVQSYGELTQMETDTQDEGDSHSFKNDLILVLDTNILLSHLEFVKKIRSHGLGAMGFPMVLVPWVVLQELDSLKNSKRKEGSVTHLAVPAVHFIYGCLKRQEPRLWGQSMQQASEGNRRLNAENNDDRILQCCLQYQTLHPESALILCTNDKNLCSKALLSGVKALCQADLQRQSGKSHVSALPRTPTATPRPPRTQQPSSSSSSILGAPPARLEALRFPVEALPKARRGDGGGQAGGAAQGKRLSLCVALLDDCLKEALSHILEVEMKAAFEDLWKDIVYVKPPWEVHDVLECMRKHWIAVFGNIVPRNLLQTVVYLSDFFSPGKTVQQDSVLAALREACELLGGFGKTKTCYGGRVSMAVAALDTIKRQLVAQPEHVPDEAVVGDALMSDHEEKQALPAATSHQRVWALFENIWSNLCQISSALFAALHFDPGTMRRTVPEGAPPPPEDVLACLHKLPPMVTQLLQEFCRVLSSDIGMEESQALLSFIHASQIVSINTHLRTRDVVACFSHQEYREKLKVGGTQLTELKVSLDNCVTAMNQSNPTWP